MKTLKFIFLGIVCTLFISCTDINKRLKDAVKDNNLEKIDRLCKRGADPTKHPRGKGYNQPALEYAANFYPEALPVLLKYVNNIDQIVYNESTALHCASEIINFESVKILVKAGADVNKKDENGCTPLMRVVYCNPMGIKKRMPEIIQISKYLVDNGANIYSEDNDGNTAYDVAYNRYTKLTINPFEVPEELIEIIAPYKAKRSKREIATINKYKDMSNSLSRWRNNLDEGDDVRLFFDLLLDDYTEDWYINSIYSNGDYLLKSNSEYGSKKVTKYSLFPPSWSESKIKDYLKN
jgi:hypothetical protein